MIRKYQPEDSDDAVAAWESATRVAHPFFDEAFLASERENVRNLYLPHAETWVWEAEGRVVGFIALLAIEGEQRDDARATAEVGGLFLEPALHGRGIGSALLRHARELKGDLEVEVFRANSIGRAFYDRCGFEPMSESTHGPTGQRLLRLRLAAA